MPLLPPASAVHEGSYARGPQRRPAGRAVRWREGSEGRQYLRWQSDVVKLSDAGVRRRTRPFPLKRKTGQKGRAAEGNVTCTGTSESPLARGQREGLVRDKR